MALFSDNALEECSKAIMDILHMYKIGQHFKSEPEHQNQNPVEKMIQDIKQTVNNIMDHTGTPNDEWLLCTIFVINLFNHLSQAGGMPAIQKATGQMADVSKFLAF